MTTRLIYFIYFYSVFGFSQNQFTLSGSIYEVEGQETLIGANVIFPKVSAGATTNEYGFYSITLPEGTYNVKVSYLGYYSISKIIILNKDLTQNFSLVANADTLDEIVLKSDTERVNIKTAQMSVNTLNANTIKQIPVVFGEADLVKTITLLPGISSGGEGTAGFNVRGGSNDQNLILLDEATLFNSSHLFGFFSVFNPDAIKNLKLYKGGIPAKYGGRVACVLDIYQKEGNKNEFRANGGIGLVSSRVLFEGPLKKEKGSFLFGGRSTYAHLFYLYLILIILPISMI